jgi:hypothetical protein
MNRYMGKEGDFLYSRISTDECTGNDRARNGDRLATIVVTDSVKKFSGCPRSQWLTSVILVVEEAAIRRISIPGQPRQKVRL